MMTGSILRKVPTPSFEKDLEIVRFSCAHEWVISPGIEPGSPVPQTGILSVELRDLCCAIAYAIRYAGHSLL